MVERVEAVVLLRRQPVEPGRGLVARRLGAERDPRRQVRVASAQLELALRDVEPLLPARLGGDPGAGVFIGHPTEPDHPVQLDLGRYVDHDDRVVPAHSFKYAAALQAAQAGDNPVLIRIDTRSGHGASSTTKAIEQTADIYSFLMYNLGVTPKWEGEKESSQ